MKTTIATFLFFANIVLAQNTTGLSEINKEDLIKNVRILYSAEFDGRLPGSEGYNKAAQFVADKFFELGLTPAGNEMYFQNLNIEYNKIEWITSSEINNNHFTLESSNDGIDFSEIVKMDGAGNSSSITLYQFEDYNPKSYYRLKQTDYNGDYTYSNIIYISKDLSDTIPIRVTNLLGQEVELNSPGLKIYYFKNKVVKKFKTIY